MMSQGEKMIWAAMFVSTWNNLHGDAMQDVSEATIEANRIVLYLRANRQAFANENGSPDGLFSVQMLDQMLKD